MTTPQIMMISIISLSAMIVFSFSLWTEKREYKDSMSFILLFLFAIITLIACLTTDEMMQLKNNKNKCPEYEKLENVYKLKE